MKNELIQMVKACLDDQRSQRNIPGLSAAAMLPDGSVIEAASGLADREQNRPMTPDTVFMQASVGKTYVAAVAVALAREGRLDLDAAIATWLAAEPWFERLPNADAITTRMLLNHSAGLLDHVHLPAFQKDAHRIGGNPDFVYDPLSLIEFILDQPPLFPAGEGFAYTDTGFIIAALIIERAAGRAYYDELKYRILDPLVLRDTFPAISRAIPRLCQAYRAADNPFGLPAHALANGLLNHHPANEWAGGGLASTAADMARFAHGLFHRDLIMPGYSKEVVASGRSITLPYRGIYGLGAFVSDSSYGRRIGHGGWMPGYRSDLNYYEDHGIAIAVMANTDMEGICGGQDIIDIATTLAGSAITGTVQKIGISDAVRS